MTELVQCVDALCVGLQRKFNRRDQRPERFHDLLEDDERDFGQDGPSDREESISLKFQWMVWIFEIYQRNVRDQMRLEVGLWNVIAKGHEVSPNLM